MSKDIKVIAEIGINHKGSSEVARGLIDSASRAGAWGVKFQYRRKDNFYKQVTEIGDEMISAEMERTYLSPSVISALREYAQVSRLHVGISFFNPADRTDFGDNLKEFDFYKVPSAELLNDDLIRSLKEQGKLVLVSTGGHDEKQIFGQVNRYAECKNVVFMHCISNYPILLGNQQLGFISKLKDVSPNPVGYSSHDQDWEVNLIAMSLGAEYIERHLTFDKRGDGLDDSTSSEPAEFAVLCKIAAAYKNIIANEERIVNQGERINMQNLGSSLYAARSILRGEIAEIDDFEVRAPRKGLVASEFLSLPSRIATLDICAGDAVLASHFAAPVSPISNQTVQFCDKNDISIPIRLHDAKKLQALFPINNYELHLSYGEVQNYLDSSASFLDCIDLRKAYSIHLPDYMPGNRLIDPLSQNVTNRHDSISLIRACVRLAKELEDVSGKEVPIVGSFSRLLPEGKETTYRELARFLCDVRDEEGIDILPQWLPKIAWYFGGAEALDMFCGEDDIDYVLKHELNICLDVSHLILSANFAKQDWKMWYGKLIGVTKHIHLADASGIDGEGVEFGSGALSDANDILSMPPRVVLEVWQGHLADGEGFRKAIEYLGGMQ